MRLDSSQEPEESSSRPEIVPPGASSTTSTSVEPAITRVSAPSQQPLFPLWMYSAILGNGRLLACLDETGSIAQLFYPHIDAGPHVRTCLSGIQIKPAAFPSESEGQISPTPAEVSWLHEDDWQHTLHYIEATAVIEIASFNRKFNVLIERTLAVPPDNDLLITRVKVKNYNRHPLQGRWVFFGNMNIYHQHSNNCCFFDQETATLLFFAGNCHIGLKADMPVLAVSCERYDSSAPASVFRNASHGIYSGREYAVGQTSSALCYDLGTIEAEGSVERSILMCFRRSLDDVLAFSLSSQELVTEIENTISWWQESYHTSRLNWESEIAHRLYERSLITLLLLTDQSDPGQEQITGGMIAAPECDADFRSSGGYGMCWPRDGAYDAYALDLVGHHSHARKFYQWALQVQSPSGAWYQRYAVKGNVATTWGLVQFDEIGSVVWAVCQHVFLTGDMNYGRSIFPSLLRACEYMQRSLDPETGLAPLTKDLWENHDSIHLYACASTWGAFHAFSQLARSLSQIQSLPSLPFEQLVPLWEARSDALKKAIETHLWNAKEGRFLRGIQLKVYNQRASQKQSEHDDWTTHVLRQTVTVADDPIIDISLLALCAPFGVFPPNDPRIEATAQLIAERLTSPGGGILRYEGDPYRGGNPWIICTLWLAWYDLLAGKQDQALELYRWVLHHRTELDLLPEQVDDNTGKPCWIVPLGWSHAMFLLVTNVLLEKGLHP